MYLHREGGCPLTPKALEYASLMGHLDCVMYLHKVGCEHGQECEFIAERHPECLKYLIENGDDFDYHEFTNVKKKCAGCQIL